MMSRSATKLCPTLRSDLEWIRYTDPECWVVRDPLSSNFFHLSDTEYAVARLLNGRRSSAELLQAATGLLPNQREIAVWLNLFLLKLFHSQLLVPASGATLPGGRSVDQRWRRGMGHLLRLNPLAIRIPVFRPNSTSLLSHSLAHLLFHPWTILCSLLLALVSILLVLGQMVGRPEEAFQDLRLIQGDRWLWMFGLYIAIKSLHEYGHYLGCVKWNARVREIGLLFLFFTPCMYCDITDSWRVPSRWKRAAIAAAGIYVEVIIAGLAACLWLMSDQGLERTMAASVLGMCSLGTILVNGNPFFKYDGYYILSDLWGVPNLSQQASQAFWNYFVYGLGGRHPNPADFSGDMRLLAAFAIVSTIYRYFVLFVLLWLAWTFFVPAGLGFLVLLLFATTALGMLIMIRRFFDQFFAEFHASTPIRIGRVVALLILVAAVLIGATIVPLPSSIRARATLDFTDKSPIYASQTAQIQFVTDTSRPVMLGQPILTLDASDKRKELLVTQHEIDELRSKKELLAQSTVNDPSAAFEIPTIDALIEELNARKGILESELKSLQVVAPFDGYVLASSLRMAPHLVSPVDLRNSTSPLDVATTGGTVERGSLLGWFTRGTQVRFEALVAEADVKRLKRGDRATCRLDSNLSREIECQVDRISPDPIDAIPNLLVGDPFLVAIRDSTGVVRPEVPHYRVILATHEEIPSAKLGSLATIHFEVPSRTLWDQLSTYLIRAFRMPHERSNS